MLRVIAILTSILACHAQMLRVIIIVALACACISLTGAQVTPDPQCGSTKGCYPSTCPDGGCTDFHLSWQDVGEYLRFKMLSLVISEGDVWAAVAFSKDNQMKDSSVVLCRTDSMTVEIGYNDQLKNSYTSLKTSSTLKNVSLSREGSSMTCTFDRVKKPNELPTQIFSLDQPNLYYLLNANGLISVGNPQYHAKRQASPSSMSFVGVAENTTIPLTTDNPTGTPMSTTSTQAPTTTLSNNAMSLDNTISSMLFTSLLVVVTSLLRH